MPTITYYPKGQHILDHQDGIKHAPSYHYLGYSGHDDASHSTQGVAYENGYHGYHGHHPAFDPAYVPAPHHTHAHHHHAHHFHHGDRFNRIVGGPNAYAVADLHLHTYQHHHTHGHAHIATHGHGIPVGHAG